MPTSNPITAVHTLAIVLVCQVVAAGQNVRSTMAERPDFSGPWILDARVPESVPGVPDGGPIVVQQLRVDQTENTFVVTCAPSVAYPRCQAYGMGSHGSAAAAERSSTDVFWFGGSLLIGSAVATTGGDGRGRRSEYSERWSLAPDGRLEVAVRDSVSGLAPLRLIYRRAP